MAGEYHYVDIISSDYTLIRALLWFWFVLGLIFTQIIFLNTLIAMISDTFDRVWDQKNKIALSSKANFICDWN